jgi:putative intracellular protease/amidase/ADP-ribose pyrophosphatase YjhB (NUDIX family)
MTNDKPAVLVILYPGCISYEVALAAELASEKYDIITASPDGEDIKDHSGLPIKTQLSYQNVSIEGLAGVLVPGGDPGSLIHNKDVERIIARAHEKGLVIGAICAGPYVLAKSGILKGKTIAHGYGEEQLEFLGEVFTGVTLTKEMLYVDGNILTAKPEAHIAFGVEFAYKLGVVQGNDTPDLRQYYRGLPRKLIRPLALAIIRNERGELLLQEGYDSVKKEKFYRPLGGGIDFQETGEAAVVRELEEELGAKAHVSRLVATFENIYEFEGRPGHEIVLLFEAEFDDPSMYEKHEMTVVEGGQVISRAVWRSLEQIRAEQTNLYPEGLDEALTSQKPERPKIRVYSSLLANLVP